jgi:hypothetical protein
MLDNREERVEDKRGKAGGSDIFQDCFNKQGHRDRERRLG